MEIDGYVHFLLDDSKDKILNKMVPHPVVCAFAHSGWGPQDASTLCILTSERLLQKRDKIISRTYYFNVWWTCVMEKSQKGERES